MGSYRLFGAVYIWHRGEWKYFSRVHSSDALLERAYLREKGWCTAFVKKLPLDGLLV